MDQCHIIPVCKIPCLADQVPSIRHVILFGLAQRGQDLLKGVCRSRNAHCIPKRHFVCKVLFQFVEGVELADGGLRVLSDFYFEFNDDCIKLSLLCQGLRLPSLTRGFYLISRGFAEIIARLGCALAVQRVMMLGKEKANE